MWSPLRSHWTSWDRHHLRGTAPLCAAGQPGGALHSSPPLRSKRCFRVYLLRSLIRSPFSFRYVSPALLLPALDVAMEDQVADGAIRSGAGAAGWQEAAPPHAAGQPAHPYAVPSAPPDASELAPSAGTVPSLHAAAPASTTTFRPFPTADVRGMLNTLSAASDVDTVNMQLAALLSAVSDWRHGTGASGYVR